jgi:hypothetical protein
MRVNFKNQEVGKREKKLSLFKPYTKFGRGNVYNSTTGLPPLIEALLTIGPISEPKESCFFDIEYFLLTHGNDQITPTVVNGR